MSTEKDREAAKEIADKYFTSECDYDDGAHYYPGPDQGKITTYGMDCAYSGIQYARRGERELLKRFRDFQDGHSKVVLIDEIKYQGIDEFLEQEESK